MDDDVYSQSNYFPSYVVDHSLDFSDRTRTGISILLCYHLLYLAKAEKISSETMQYWLLYQYYGNNWVTFFEKLLLSSTFTSLPSEENFFLQYSLENGTFRHLVNVAASHFVVNPRSRWNCSGSIMTTSKNVDRNI